jgi:hypothetical protein
VPEQIEKRPVIKADHDGLHGASTLNEHTPAGATTGNSIAAGAWAKPLLDEVRLAALVTFAFDNLHYSLDNCSN